MVVLFFYSIVPFIYLAAVFGGYLFFMQSEAEIAVGTTAVSVVAVVMELRRGEERDSMDQSSGDFTAAADVSDKLGLLCLA